MGTPTARFLVPIYIDDNRGISTQGSSCAVLFAVISNTHRVVPSHVGYGNIDAPFQDQ